MPRALRVVFASVILGVLVGVPWGYASWRHQRFRNIHVVRDGVLYRSGQLPLAGLKRLIHDHGIKTVVTFRFAKEPNEPAPDVEEEKFCKAEHLRHFRLRHRAWEAADKSVPAEANVKQFLEIMGDPSNYPVLVHCFAGIHRTGTFCALYRMEFENWSNDLALREMKALGYADHHPDVFHFLGNYRPHAVAAHVDLAPMIWPVVHAVVHAVEPPIAETQDK